MRRAGLGQGFFTDIFFPALSYAPQALQLYQAKRAADIAKQNKERAEEAAKAAAQAEAQAETAIDALTPQNKILGLDPTVLYIGAGGLGVLLLGILVLKK